MKIKFTLLLVLLCIFCCIGSSVSDGVLPNGNFEKGPKPWQLKGTVVKSKNAIPDWEISGYVEYVKSGQKQGDMLLVVPEGEYAVRLGNDALIKQKVKVTKGAFYSITFSAARTCAQDEKLNVSIAPNLEKADDGIIPIQTLYSSSGWDMYAWGFQADAEEVEISFHNPGLTNDPACGPIIDSIALKILPLPRPTRDNLVKNGDFEEGPYITPNASSGVLIPPHVEDDHSALPGWIVESLKAVKYLDSEHFFVPNGKRAIELIAGQESALAQVVRTVPGKVYVLSFAVGDAKDSCQGPLTIEAYAGRESTKVSYTSKGKGGFVRVNLRFTAISTRTRIMFRSLVYTMDYAGSLCGPVIDVVRLVSTRSKTLA